MNIREYLKSNKLLYLDGGMGTILQERGLKPGEYPEVWNIEKPEVITEIHRAYFDVGSNVVYANTFGANSLKFTPDELERIVSAGIENARRAAVESSGGQEKFVALDIGPTGRLLKPYGDLEFEDAVKLFGEVVEIGTRAGADLIVIETMADSYETKAALLAAKENSDLPIFVTNAYGEDGKLMTGASPEAMVALIESMGADALGVNCSLGPDKLGDVIGRMIEAASIPVILKPNAGLPKSVDGKTVYEMSEEEFASEMMKLIPLGIKAAGGCCGTTPDYIRALVDGSRGLEVAYPVEKERTVISSYTHAVNFGNEPILIGERLNPTGKKLLKKALVDEDLDYVLREGIDQEERGVHALDVNVGLPEICEEDLLPKVVKDLQSVIDLPLCLDTSNYSAMENALRIYNGKALVNSVNGKEESMERIFHLIAKYGGAVIALTLDDDGIPESDQGRIDIAKKIIKHAGEYGIPKKDIIFDALTLTISASPDAGKVTLRTVERINKELGCATVLGISNVSFGLPDRDGINSVFYANALERGLSAAILNPKSESIMRTYYSFRALQGLDANFVDYIEFSERHRATAAAVPAAAASAPTVAPAVEPAAAAGSEASPEAQLSTVQQGEASGQPAPAPASDLQYAILKGLKERAASAAELLLENKPPLEIIENEIIPALNEVGRKFEAKELYLPQLLMSAETAGEAFDVIKKKMINSEEWGTAKPRGKVVVATVKGDIHDIGKNIVKLLLQNYGFDVKDMGKDVAPEDIVEYVVKENVRICGLSALMTTTVPSMEETIRQLREAAPWCKVIVGGAVLTQDYAEMIGADSYGKDAMETVRFAEDVDEG